MIHTEVLLQGRPFREGIRENPALYYGLLGAGAVAFGGAIDLMPELNRWLQIVEMTSAVSFASVITRNPSNVFDTVPIPLDCNHARGFRRLLAG